jgi:hypothetical protein
LSLINWRKWVHDTLTGSISLSAVNILAAGSVTSVPEKPFIVYHLDDDMPVMMDGGMPVASYRTCRIWAYDEVGSYETVDSLLDDVRKAMIGPVSSSNGISCDWEGDSGELVDDVYDAITRNSTYRLVGRN